MGGFYIPSRHSTGVVKFSKKKPGDAGGKMPGFLRPLNSLVLCAFMPDGGQCLSRAIRDLFNAITGWDLFLRGSDGRRGEGVYRSAAHQCPRRYDGRPTPSPRNVQPAGKGFGQGKTPPLKELLGTIIRSGLDENGIPTAGL